MVLFHNTLSFEAALKKVHITISSDWISEGTV